MKNTYLIIALLLALSLNAQRKVSLAVYQDARLMLVGDKDHGYDAGTLNIVTRLKMQGHQLKNGYMVVFPEFEYADLEGIYKRYSLNVGYTFNQWSQKLEFSAYIGYGFIDRYALCFFSTAASGEVAYKINKKLKLNLMAQFTERKDLAWLYGTNDIRFSGFIGLEYNIN